MKKLKKFVFWLSGIGLLLLLAIFVALKTGILLKILHGPMPDDAEIAAHLEEVQTYGLYLDREYSEPLLAKEAPIDHIQYDTASGIDGWIDYMETILDIRYPVGKINVAGGIAAMGTRDKQSAYACLQPFYSVHPLIDMISLFGVKSLPDAVNMAPLAVHECGHVYELQLNGRNEENQGRVAYYQITPENVLFAENLGLIKDGGKTFSRTLLRDDAFSDLPGRMKTCDSYSEKECDTWSQTYLNIETGFDLLLEEFSQYTHALAAAYFLDDYDKGRKFFASATSATVAFRWYVMRYLYLARTEHPDVYDVITKSPCNVNTVLTLWDRSSFYLDVTRDHGQLNRRQNALQYRAVEKNPQLRQEIAALRELDRTCSR